MDEGPAQLLARLASELPASGAEDPQDQARALLRRVIERPRPHKAEMVPADPATCPNCGDPADSARTPYCGTHCKQIAAFIRQFRTSLADSSILDPQRQIGLGQALWALQGGGFPLRQLLVPPKVRTKVIARDGGVCAVCGAPATEVDHTGSG